jgi:hypothetical protein
MLEMLFSRMLRELQIEYSNDPSGYDWILCDRTTRKIIIDLGDDSYANIEHVSSDVPHCTVTTQNFGN